jgi:hypothetical protein
MSCVNFTYPETSHSQATSCIAFAVGASRSRAESPAELSPKRRCRAISSPQSCAGRAASKATTGGGIETWQGGRSTSSQHCHQPGRLKNWCLTPATQQHRLVWPRLLSGRLVQELPVQQHRAGPQQHAWHQSVNTTALQNVHSFENSFFTTPFTGSPKSRASKTPAPPARAICRTSSKIRRA